MGSLEHEAVAAAQFRAAELARRTVEYHNLREAEHRARDRLGARFTPYPWAAAAAAVLADEVLEDEALMVGLIRELGRQGCSEVALAALDLVLARGGPSASPSPSPGGGGGPRGLAAPSKALFDSALLVCAAEYQDERCMALLARMRQAGVAPDVGSLNLVLTGLCCRGRLEAAVALLEQERAQAAADGGMLVPNSYTVLMILQACNYKRRGAYREAIEAVRALEASGGPANEEVVEALLCVCEAAMHKARSFEAAVEVFAALADLQLADSTRVYNGLLGAAGRAGRWREAQALYVAMQADDIPASLETHTALIQACVVGRALDHALDIFEFLVAGRAAHELVPASITTYNHLIHACHQAGMLEKALEIAAWVQKTGVEFDDNTYEELMATIEVAQLWDEKAMKQALKRNPAVLPAHLRPAPYDAMRVLYLDHLEALQQEELLALEKLGTLGSWAPKSLTKGLMGEQHEQMMREQQQQQTAAAEASGWRGPGGGSGGGGGQLDAEASSVSASGPPLSYRDMAVAMRASMSGQALSCGGGGGGAAAALAAVTGSGMAAESSASSLAGGGGCGSPGLLGGPSMRQLLTSMSMKRIGGSGGPGGPQQGAAAAALSFRPSGMRSVLGPGGMAALPDSPTASSAAASISSPSGAAAAAAASQQQQQQQGAAGGSGSEPAPTGFNHPPTWAQVQVADAATAGPGGTPFVTPQAAAARGPAGVAASGVPLLSLGGGVALALAVEPANLVGQPSAASLGAGSTPRVSARAAVSARSRAGPLPLPGIGGAAVGAGGLPAVVGAGQAGGVGAAAGLSGLSLLSEPSSGAVGQAHGSPRAGAGPLPAAGGSRLRAVNPNLQVAVGGPVSRHDFLPSPLPVMPPSSLGAGSGRRPGGLR
ncbi:hypothetical protein HYH02_013774 [Chlamydomonas schloesseri]|uniref:Pentacotripeptide-repeat region of PRORP domain-containing protein n=1 Tax=Chlamydomonas schloesseri TaxID=2026947 RepID=A0A835T2D0_9CHLO|nr:hypothetical protein HYH02_013774 [Chlamydomonas schloesseri]|eukprot:KAG2430296.1 hypothetical protein HYH02_013774 [Chlamydomonas schloesseri]